MTTISIITINYNNDEGLERTIKSVQKQTASNYEYIVIDGNSTDGSKNIIETYKDNFNYWVSEPDSGIYNAMNKGIKVSKGDYLLFLNSGDTLIDANILIDLTAEVIKDKTIGIYYGDLLYGTHEVNNKATFPSKLTFNYFFEGGYIPHPSTFIKRNLFELVGLYNEMYKITSDWDFFIRAICKHNIRYSYFNRVVTLYDINGLSANSDFQLLKVKEKQQTYIDHFSSFIDDYKDLKTKKGILNSNRFKLLLNLEKNKFAQKINSLWLRILNKLFRL